MYFFKVVLSLFDEDKETLFIIPDTDTLGKDELPELFDSVITSHPKFTAFAKRTKGAVIDVNYELYETKDVLEEITESEFELMQQQKMLKLLDSIDFCIQVRKIKQHSKKKKGGSAMLLIIGVAAAVVLLIAGGVYKASRSKEEPPPEIESEITSEITESTDSSESGLEELPIDDVISSVPEVVESYPEYSLETSDADDYGNESYEGDGEQLPENDENPTSTESEDSE